MSSIVAYLVHSKRTQTPDLPPPVDISDAVRDYNLNIEAIRRTESIMKARYENGERDPNASFDEVKKEWEQELAFQKIAIRED